MNTDLSTLSVTVNIGLRSSERYVSPAIDIAPSEALSYLRRLGEVTDWELHRSSTEETLVARFQFAQSLESLKESLSIVSWALLQDCIAAVADGEPLLVGPHAETWAPFNPALFITLGGRTLADELQVVA